MNKITFSKFTCTVISKTTSNVTCEMDTTSEISTNMWLPLSVDVVGYGTALIDIKDYWMNSAIFKLAVTDVFPLSGSRSGGTLITIRGFGFLADTVVSVAGSECIQTNRTYYMITCVTPECAECPEGNVQKKVNVYDSTYQTEQQAAVNTVHKFNYDESLTPVIHSVSPGTLDEVDESLTITGVRFGNASRHLTITINNVPCDIDSFNVSSQTNQIVCHVTAVEVGELI